MPNLMNAWMVDRAPGASTPVFNSGTLVSGSTLTGITGVGTGQTSLPGSYPTLQASGTVLPTPNTGGSYTGAFLAMKNAVGFDGSTYLYGLPTHAAASSFSLSCWVNFYDPFIVGYDPNSTQGAIYQSLFTRANPGYPNVAQSTASLCVMTGIQQESAGTLYTAFGIPIIGPAWNAPGPGFGNLQVGATLEVDSEAVLDAWAPFVFPGAGPDTGWVNMLYSLHAVGGFFYATVYANDYPLLQNVNTFISSANIIFNQADYTSQGYTFDPDTGLLILPAGGSYAEKNCIGGGANLGLAGIQSSAPVNGNGWKGEMTELWIAPGQYIDFTVAANRAKFHNTDLTGAVYDACDLGSTGALPTGSAPLIYCSGGSNLFPANRAQAGTFTVSGALFDVDNPPQVH